MTLIPGTNYPAATWIIYLDTGNMVIYVYNYPTTTWMMYMRHGHLCIYLRSASSRYNKEKECPNDAY